MPDTRELAYQFTNNLPNLDKLTAAKLSDELQLFIAEVISIVIGAGSERDAVMESEPLTEALFQECRSWYPWRQHKED